MTPCLNLPSMSSFLLVSRTPYPSAFSLMLSPRKISPESVSLRPLKSCFSSAAKFLIASLMPNFHWTMKVSCPLDNEIDLLAQPSPEITSSFFSNLFLISAFGKLNRLMKTKSFSTLTFSEDLVISIAVLQKCFIMTKLI